MNTTSPPCRTSITEHIDTTQAGRMMLQMVGAFAEFEREMTHERIHAGLAGSKGWVGGCRPKLSPKRQAELVRGVQEERDTQAEVVRLFGVHPATVSRLMAARRSVLT